MLEIRGLSKNFGGISAVSGLDFVISEGEIAGLIGPNGAGKTTVFNLLTGYLRPDKGAVWFNGEPITGRKPHSIAKKGIARTFQDGAVFPKFTVIQNIVASHHLQPAFGFWGALFHAPSSRKKEDHISSQALEIVKFLGLEKVKDRLAGNLPHGYKRIVSIAIAMATQPRILLLDEPLSGMNAEEVDRAVALIRKIRERKGITILLIEHNMRAAMSLCQRIIVLGMGRKIAEGTPDEVRTNRVVIEAYLGSGKNAA
ncbi:MAG: ABC transporter ATP-binding protein [Thermodesulfobacteriota bacterium]